MAELITALTYRMSAPKASEQCLASKPGSQLSWAQEEAAEEEAQVDQEDVPQ
jgi:hypothetical protein